MKKRKETIPLKRVKLQCECGNQIIWTELDNLSQISEYGDAAPMCTKCGTDYLPVKGEIDE